MSKYPGKLGELYQTYSRLVSQWPADKLRPTHCYKNALNRHMKSNFDRVSVMRGESVNAELATFEREIDSLTNLLKNRYKSQSTLSSDMADPVSNKGYYTKLLSSIDNAVKANRPTSLRVD
ncbi:hypothetical protein H4S06_004767 [Coemansia sp. BCRC 34490]|nr:hypothetical protein H4S06_004767 [Coemansia sp. BCRC 34490]